MSSTITALPFFAGEMDSFDPLDSSVKEATTSETFDPLLSRCAIFVPSGTSGARSVKWPEASTLWMADHFREGGVASASGDGAKIFVFYSAAGVEVAQVRAYGTAKTLELWSLQSGVMTLIGATTILGILQRINVKLVAGGAGEGALYVAGTLIFHVTGLNHSGWTGIAQYGLFGGNSIGGGCSHSQIIAKTTSTVGNFVKTDDLDTESGAPNNAWVGGVSDINEIVYSDVTFISTGTPNDVSTFYDSTLDLTGLSVLGRGVGARMRVQDAGPTQRQLVLESGGTNFFSASAALTVGFEAQFNSWTTNPNGSVTWTDATAQATKGGVKAIA